MCKTCKKIFENKFCSLVKLADVRSIKNNQLYEKQSKATQEKN